MDGTKHDDGKPKYDLLPPNALEDLVKVLTFGAEKYDADNWRKVPDAYARYFSAAQRHLWEFKRGGVTDEESGLPHLAHAMACIMFLCEMDRDIG